MNFSKKTFIIFFLFFLFLENNSFFSISKINSYQNKEIIITIEKSKLIKNWIISYRASLIKIKNNYDLKQDSVLQKNLSKIDEMIITLDKIINKKIDFVDSENFLKKIVKDFNSLKKQNSNYLKNILNNVDNPKNLKKVKKEFDILASYSNKVSYKLDSLIYKFKKYLDSNSIKNSSTKKELRKSLKKLYIISLKLKNFKKYIYMWKKPPKSTFKILLDEIKKEVLKIKKLLRKR